MKLFVLVERDLARARLRLSIVGSAILLSVATLVFLGALLLGAHRHIAVPLLPRLPLDLIKVEERTMSLGVFAIGSDSLGQGFDDARLNRLASIAGVERVYPILGAAFGLRAEGGARFLGSTLRTDLFATGIDPALVTGDLPPNEVFVDPGRDADVVPVIVARRLLDLYNTTVSAAIDKPKLTEAAVIGFTFDLVLGSSTVRGTPDPSKIERKIARIVALSDHTSLVGIAVPSETLRRWNESHSSRGTPIVGAYLKTRSAREAGDVASAAEALGFRVDDTQKTVSTIVNGGLFAFALFLTITLVLLGFVISQTFTLFVFERRTEFATLRAMGARRRDIRRIILIEAAALGAVAGLFGVLAGMGGASLLDAFLSRLALNLPLVPASFVAFPWWLLSGSWVVGIFACGLGALVPAHLASRSDTAVALRAD